MLTQRCFCMSVDEWVGLSPSRLTKAIRCGQLRSSKCRPIATVGIVRDGESGPRLVRRDRSDGITVCRWFRFRAEREFVQVDLANDTLAGYDAAQVGSRQETAPSEAWTASDLMNAIIARGAAS